MRKIIFRGKDEDTKEWLYGFYTEFQHPNHMEMKYCICTEKSQYTKVTGVIPETVGQFTGLLDKNGREAYSGDVYIDGHGVTRTIWSDQGGFRSESNPLSFGYGGQGNRNPSMALADQQTASWFEGNCEIIGNIHDNTELLQP